MFATVCKAWPKWCTPLVPKPPSFLAALFLLSLAGAGNPPAMTNPTQPAQVFNWKTSPPAECSTLWAASWCHTSQVMRVLMCSSALFRKYAIVNIQPQCMKGSRQTSNSLKRHKNPIWSYLHLVAIEWHKPGHLANPRQTAQDLPWQSFRHEITSMLASDCADCRILEVRNEKSDTAGQLKTHLERNRL